MNIQVQLHAMKPVAQNYDELSFYATFHADVIISQLTAALEKNLSSKDKARAILEKVQNDLITMAWHDRVGQDMKRVSQATTEAQVAAVVASLEDKVAFIQLLGGLDPPAAAEAKIKHNFLMAFNRLAVLVMSCTKKWPDAPLSREARKKFMLLCYKTMAELLNVNCVYCETPEILTKCLWMVMDQDGSGSLAQLFIPSLQSYYNRFVIDAFRTRLQGHQLVAVLNAALRMGIDLTEELDQVRDDNRKCAVLMRADALKEQALRYVTKCDDVDLVIRAMRMFKKNRDIANQYFHVLSTQLSKWINALLKAVNIREDNEVKETYNQLQKLTQQLSPRDRESVFAIVKSTELEQALRAVVSRIKPPIDFYTETDKMMQDIGLMIRRDVK